MNYIVSASTDIGNTKQTNQDSLNVKVMTINGEKAVFAILCDGMGGLQKGEVASASVVKAFCGWAVGRLPMLYAGLSNDVIRQEWASLVSEYNTKLAIYGKKSAITLGTTLTVMLFAGPNYYIGHVGDSRAYEITSGVTVLTKDQTVVEREVEQGILTKEQAANDPRRSVLLQCIGASDVVYPDFYFGQIKQNAVYMLCSDGFRHEITPQEIGAYFHPDRMTSQENMQANERALIDLNKQRQERDNISVITIRTF